MEYILKDTDIFDENIDIKFEEIIKPDINIYTNEIKLVVSFNVKLLDNPKIKEFKVPKQYEWGNKCYIEMSNVMNFQLSKIEHILEKYGIKALSSTIQGDTLKTVNIIKIEMSNITNKIISKHGRTTLIMAGDRAVIPNLAEFQEPIIKAFAEYYCKIFRELMDVIGDKKIMSEILDIPHTEDGVKLINAFYEQYHDLSPFNNENNKELLDSFVNKAITVFRNNDLLDE